MSEVKPATDEFLDFHFGNPRRSPHDYECIEPECAGWTCHTVSALVARIESDREEIAALHAGYSDLMALMQEQYAEKDAEIARLKAEVSEWEEKAKNWLASPEAAARLDGYRAFGQRAADAERLVDAVLMENTKLKAEVERLSVLRCNDGLCRCCTGRAR